MIQKKVRDLTVPLSRYCVVPPNATLAETVGNIYNTYCDQKGRFCKKARPRTVFVVNDQGALEGILDLSTILRILMPEVTGGVSDRLGFLGASVAFAEAGVDWLDESRANLFARVSKNARTKVSEIMTKIKISIQGDSSLFEALDLFYESGLNTIPVYEGDKLIGVVKDYDLFIEIVNFLGI